MSEKLEIFKKKLLYRASYRGTKEMDILLKTYENKLKYSDFLMSDTFLVFQQYPYLMQ